MTPDPATGAPPAKAAIWFLGLVTVFFVVQTALRLSYAASLTLDEAEMLVVTQDFAFGYGASQPPLYGWLVLAAFKLFGVGVPALAITKHLLLWTTFVLIFLSGRIIFRDELKAALIAAALVTIPQISWKALFDLTHSVGVVTMTALTFYVFLLLLRNGRWFDYVLFGVCVALGLLSKYNFGIFAVALLVASASLPSLRFRILSPWMLAALGLSVVLLIPHLHWVLTHQAVAMSRVGKLGIAENLSVAGASGQALLGLIRALISCLLLSLAVFALIAFFPIPKDAAPQTERTGGWTEGKQLVLRTLAISFVLVLVLVIVSRTTLVRDHWLLPLLLLLPMGLFILFESRFTPVKTKMLGAVSAGLAVAFMLGIAGAHFFPDLADRPPRASAPFRVIADTIRSLGFKDGYVLADSTYTAGNLKLRFPESRAGEPEYGLHASPARGGSKPALVAWAGSDSEPPSGLKRLWRTLCGNPPAGLAHEAVTAPFQHSKRALYRLNVIIQPVCTPPSE